MIESERKIGAIEGNSFSGKTTLVEGLESNFGFSVVQEPNTYVTSLPSFPPDSYADAKKAIDIFVEVEKRRSSDAINLAESGYVVMDRSLWTYPAFQYVVMRRMPNVPNSYLYSLDVLREQIESGEIIAPGALVSLVLQDQREFQKRVGERGGVNIGFLNDWETTVLMENLFGVVIDRVYTESNGRRIIATGSIQAITRETDQFLHESEYSVNAILVFDQLKGLK